VVEVLVVNDTSPVTPAGSEKVTGWVKAMVEPSAAEGVQAAGFGVTAGGATPVATTVALLRLKSTSPVMEELVSTVPETSPTDGMAPGASEIMKPAGIVTLAVTVASPSRLQLMPIVSGAPELSVRVTGDAPVHVNGDEFAELAKRTTPTPVTL
jgi:uncharacterized membrane protein